MYLYIILNKSLIPVQKISRKQTRLLRKCQLGFRYFKCFFKKKVPVQLCCVHCHLIKPGITVFLIALLATVYILDSSFLLTKFKQGKEAKRLNTGDKKHQTWTIYE